MTTFLLKTTNGIRPGKQQNDKLLKILRTCVYWVPKCLCLLTNYWFIVGLRNFSSSNVMSKKIEEFVVIGGGLMGAGIAQVSNYNKNAVPNRII